MTTCPTCKAELLRLAPLPGLLQRLSPEDYAAIETEDEIQDWPLDFPADLDMVDLDSIPPEPEPRPVRPGWLRRQRTAVVAAAAVVLLAVGGFLFVAPDEDAPPPVASGQTTQPIIQTSWSADDPSTGVHGKVVLTKRGWGTELLLSMDGVPAGKKVCHMVVYGRDGSAEIAGQWAAGNYTVLRAAPGSTSIQLADIDHIEVVAGGGLLVGIRAS